MDPKRKRPLTIPTQIELIDGVEWLTFVYTAKGASTNYRIRIDTSSVKIDELDPTFKAENCVYPKANINRELYKGNRWDYETSVNEVGWKLSYLNQDLLIGKRGLLQRAVDRFPDSKSRRVARVEKEKGLAVETKKRRKKRSDLADTDQITIEKNEFEDDPISLLLAAMEPSITNNNFPYNHKLEHENEPSGINDWLTNTQEFETPRVKKLLLKKMNVANTFSEKDTKQTRLIVETVRNSSPYQLKLQMDIGSITDIKKIPRDLIQNNQPFQKPKTLSENKTNSIAWKLAYLNPELNGHLELLQRCVDVYRERFDVDFKAREGKKMMAQFLK